eukprot:c18549_g1_i1 orf=1-216(-)
MSSFFQRLSKTQSIYTPLIKLTKSAVSSQSAQAIMADSIMRAVQYASYVGGPAALKHVEVPVPKPKKGEVLV